MCVWWSAVCGCVGCVPWFYVVFGWWMFLWPARIPPILRELRTCLNSTAPASDDQAELEAIAPSVVNAAMPPGTAVVSSRTPTAGVSLHLKFPCTVGSDSYLAGTKVTYFSGDLSDPEAQITVKFPTNASLAGITTNVTRKYLAEEELRIMVLLLLLHYSHSAV